jgi:hypothetical protein
MRIPNNSNFSKEIAKKFKQIFHRDMTLGGLQDLQEQLDLISPVDTHLLNQVSQLKEKRYEKNNTFMWALLPLITSVYLSTNHRLKW